MNKRCRVGTRLEYHRKSKQTLRRPTRCFISDLSAATGDVRWRRSRGGVKNVIFTLITTNTQASSSSEAKSRYLICRTTLRMLRGYSLLEIHAFTQSIVTLAIFVIDAGDVVPSCIK